MREFFVPPVCPQKAASAMVKLTNDLLKRALPEPGKRLELRDDDEPGLIFRVTEGGVRSWSLRYRNEAGEQRRKALGTYPAVTLSRAREEARKIKGAVASGKDVVGEDRARRDAEAHRRLSTFGALAEAYFADAALGLHRANARSPKRPRTIEEERRIWDRLVAPKFAQRPATEIARAEIQAFVSAQARKVKSNGRHCRTVIRQIMSYAVAKGVLDSNPAHDIAVAMPEPRERILTDGELTLIWRAFVDPSGIEGLTLSVEMGRALRMAAVTLQRRSEVVAMRWDEIDRVKRLWTVPAARMKGKRTHVVPLSPLAMAILDESDESSPFVFQSPRSDAHLDPWAFSRAMARVVAALQIPKATAHDLRRTGATNLTSEKIGVPRFVVSMVLAHAGDTGGAAVVTGRHYDLNDYLPEKRRALEAWADYIQRLV